MLPVAIGIGMAAASLLSSASSSFLGGQAGNAAFGQSVYAAGLKMRAGEQESAKYKRLASQYYMDAYDAGQKKDLSLSELRREHKIVSGKMRGQQQGLESDGTTRSMTVEQQEKVLEHVRDVVEWEWDVQIRNIETAAREANYAGHLAYLDGVNSANATLYSGGQTAAAYINQANMTMAMALPKAAVSGLSGYFGAGGTLGSAATTTTEAGADRAANIATLFQY